MIHAPLHLALYQPDIAQNTGTMLRLCACLHIPVDFIGPAGFPSSDSAFKRAGMDYLDAVKIIRHSSWQAFERDRQEAFKDALKNQKNIGSARRVILASTKAAVPYTEFAFQAGDTILMGRESAGVPDDVWQASDARVFIPMKKGMRSLNVAVSAAMILGEALRQTGGFTPAHAA